MTTVDVALSAGNTMIGSAGGKTALLRLRQSVSLSVESPKIVALDFASMSMVTASAVRAGLLPILDELLANGHFGILVNLANDTIDEVQLAAEASKKAVTVATLAEGELGDCRILGVLDVKLKDTLEHVVALGEADAKTVNERAGEQTVVTVWNNRLVALHALGLVTEKKVGRTKLYAPIVKGLTYGS